MDSLMPMGRQVLEMTLSQQVVSGLGGSDDAAGSAAAVSLFVRNPSSFDMWLKPEGGFGPGDSLGRAPLKRLGFGFRYIP